MPQMPAVATKNAVLAAATANTTRASGATVIRGASAARVSVAVIGDLFGQRGAFSPQWFQYVTSVAGLRRAFLKSSPIVYATGSSATWVTVSGMPCNAAGSFS